MKRKKHTTYIYQGNQIYHAARENRRLEFRNTLLSVLLVFAVLAFFVAVGVVIGYLKS